MACSNEKRVGYLRGKTSDGNEAVVGVSKIGRHYRISYGFKDRLCHPSVRDIEAVRREALLVFDIRDATYQSV